jgi:hypothetical protein
MKNHENTWCQWMPSELQFEEPVGKFFVKKQWCINPAVCINNQ